MSIDTTTVNTIIGSRVRLRRRARGLTLRGLAAGAGLSIGYLSDLERGVRGISAGNLLALASALGVTPNWFFRPLLRGEG